MIKINPKYTIDKKIDKDCTTFLFKYKRNLKLVLRTVSGYDNLHKTIEFYYDGNFPENKSKRILPDEIISQDAKKVEYILSGEGKTIYRLAEVFNSEHGRFVDSENLKLYDLSELEIRIANVEPLTQTLERKLFLTYNYYRRNLNRETKIVLNSKINSKIYLHVKNLVENYAGALKTKDILIKSNYYLLPYIIKKSKLQYDGTKLFSNDAIYDDLITKGYEALVRSIKTFDVSRQNKFSTYVCTSIKNLVINKIKTLKRRKLILDSDFTEDSLFDNLIRNRAMSEFREELKDTYKEDCLEILEEIMNKNLACLDKRELAILENRIPLNGSTKLTLNDAGKLIGNLTKERVRQIQNEALKKIKVVFNEKLELLET